MFDAIAHTRAHKSQMGVSIARFDDFLSVCQLGAKIHLIVAVCGAFRKQCAKRAKELREQVIAVVHPHCEAAIEIAGRRVWGNKKHPLVAPEKVTGLSDSGGHVERLETALRGHSQLQF